MIVEVIRADITEEEREKILNRVAILSGILLKGIMENGISPNNRYVEQLKKEYEEKVDD